MHFYNQFAGHVETRLASISDPAMGLYDSCKISDILLNFLQTILENL